jgi:hypothetical protein
VHPRPEPHPPAVVGLVAVLERFVRLGLAGDDRRERLPEPRLVLGVDEVERVRPDELLRVEPDHVGGGRVQVPVHPLLVEDHDLVLGEVQEGLGVRPVAHTEPVR